MLENNNSNLIQISCIKLDNDINRFPAISMLFLIDIYHLEFNNPSGLADGSISRAPIRLYIYNVPLYKCNKKIHIQQHILHNL